MADTFPVTVQTTLVTFGRYYAPDASIDRSGQVEISLDRELYLVGSGDVIEPIVVGAVPQTDGQYQIRLPKTGQAGVVDANGTPITTWYYTATWTGFKYKQKRPVKFDLPASLGDVYDGDRFSPAVTPPTVIPTPTWVTSVTVGGISYPGPAVVLPDGIGGGAGDVDSLIGATDLGKSLLKSGDANAALTQLGINGLPATVAAKADLAQVAAAVSDKATITQMNTGLAGKLDANKVNAASGVAPLGTDKLLPRANLSTGVAIEVDAVGGVCPPRPAYAGRVYWNAPVPGPVGGGTIAGGGGAVDNLDKWNVTAS